MIAQFFFRERQFLRLGQRHRGLGFRHVARFIADNQRQRLADETVNLHDDGALKPRHVARETLAQALVEFGIVRLPNLVADADAQKINIAVAEAQFRQFLAGDFEARFLNLVNPPTLLLFIRPAGVENNAVAQFDGRGEIDDDAVADNFFDFAEIHAALFAEPRVDELPVVRAAEPAGEQPARKRHLHFVFTIGDFGLTRGQVGGA